VTAIGSVSIDRTSLSLSALVADTEGFGAYYVDAKGLGRIGRTPRLTTATASPYVHGQLHTAAVLEESVLNLVLRVNGTSSSDLDTKVTALEGALFQFVYGVTVVVSGVTRVWTAYPATIQSTDALVAFERVTAFYEDLTISIPVYPVSA